MCLSLLVGATILKGMDPADLEFVAGVIKTGFGDNAASYQEGVKDNNKALEEELCMSKSQPTALF